MGQFQSYHAVDELGKCGQLSQTLFGNRLKPGLAKHLVSLVHLGSCELSVQGNGWWRFFLKLPNCRMSMRGIILILSQSQRNPSTTEKTTASNSRQSQKFLPSIYCQASRRAPCRRSRRLYKAIVRPGFFQEVYIHSRRHMLLDE